MTLISRQSIVYVCLIVFLMVGGAVPARVLIGQSPSLITGTLPSGLRYYIHANKMPASRAFLWLAVNAGSINEDDDQKGFAHFLEHMAFNGTHSFPGNKLIDVVEKAGMNFGPDLNAYTSFDETVYQLTIPTDDSTLFDRGMQILEDWASGKILNDSLEVVAERGVVLGEWRARLADTASTRFQRETMKRIFGKDSRYVDRFPIGDPDLLRKANPAELKRFYEDWYRPDLMAIIAVGDFDPVWMEEEIKRRFGNIAGPANPRKFERPVIERSSPTTVQIVRDLVRPEVEFMWPAVGTHTSVVEAVKAELLEQLVVTYLQRSLSVMSKLERRPFALASFKRINGFARPIGQNYQVRVSAHPDSLMYGFSQVITEIQRLSEHGLPHLVLDREKSVLARRYEQYVEGAVAIPSRELAQKYVGHYLRNEGHTLTPAEHLAIVRELLPQISNTDIRSFASRWKDGDNRVVVVHIPKFSTLRFLEEGDVLTLLDSIAGTQLTAVSPFIRESNGKSGPVFSFADGATGAIERRKSVPDASIHKFQLSNGARVILKPTSVNPDEVVLHAHSPGGHSLLPDSLFYSPGRLVTALMTASGGWGEKSRRDFENDLSSTGIRDFQVDLNAFNEEMVVRGSPRELETMFQLMYAQFTNPTIDTLALSEWRRTGAQTLKMSRNDVLAMEVGRHKRLSPPQRARVPFIDLDQAMSIYMDRFGDASDFTFIIVGAVDSQQVTPLIERYLASLPSTNRPDKETPRSFGIQNPMYRSVRSMEHPIQNEERAQMRLAFSGDISSETAYQERAERAKIETLSLVLSRRLRNRLREEMAVTYSIGAPALFYVTPEERYVILINLMTAPEVIDTSTEVVWKEIRSLYNEGPSQEELDIARTVLERRLENSKQSNSWWVSQLISADNAGISFDVFNGLSIPEFTSEDIRQTAVKYMPKDIYDQQILKPVKKSTQDQEKKTQEKEKQD